MMDNTDNYFGAMLIALCDHIKTQVPAIRWVDQDLGQLESYEIRPSVDFPCVLIDFGMASYSELAELAQIGEVMVVVRIGYAPFSQSHGAAPTLVREKALEFYTIEQDVYKAVQGFETEYTTPFTCKSRDTERRDDTLRVRALTFDTSYEDHSAAPMLQKVPATVVYEYDPEP